MLPQRQLSAMTPIEEGFVSRRFLVKQSFGSPKGLPLPSFTTPLVTTAPPGRAADDSRFLVVTRSSHYETPAGKVPFTITLLFSDASRSPCPRGFLRCSFGRIRLGGESPNVIAEDAGLSKNRGAFRHETLLDGKNCRYAVTHWNPFGVEAMEDDGSHPKIYKCFPKINQYFIFRLVQKMCRVLIC